MRFRKYYPVKYLTEEGGKFLLRNHEAIDGAMMRSIIKIAILILSIL
jgi:hypothetical protein